MSLRSTEFYEARAKIARALAHPSRLLLMDALREQESSTVTLAADSLPETPEVWVLPPVCGPAPAG